MAPLPAPNTPLCDIELPALSVSAREQLTRVCAFLYVVCLPEIQTRALLADYTPEILAGHFTEETLNLLALGEPVPPPLPDVPLSLLARFRPAARA
ncbi:hypothetical protein WME79_19615 [Sorangium sp. So ce726]|uniref:hypothetical protein n=1 Tax=Sorangium sp. So ce726 TaxID=3133319 RepID=UPI003F629FAF